MALDLNFDGIGDGPPILDEGDYVLVIADAQVKAAKSGEGQVLHLTFEANGIKIRQYMSLKRDALWAVKRFLQAVYQQELDGPLTLDEKELVGMSVTATIGQQPRNDNPDLMQNTIVAYKMP